MLLKYALPLSIGLLIGSFGKLSSLENSTPSHFHVDLDLLVWNATEGGADNWAQNISTPLPGVGHVVIYDASFEMALGYRIQAGYDFSWLDFVLGYTFYQTQAKRSLPYNQILYSAFMGNYYYDNITSVGVDEPFYHQAKMVWHIGLNSLDLEIGKSFFPLDTLSFRPYFGLKGAIIDQKIKTYWLDTIADEFPFDDAKEFITQDWRGIGPLFGVDSNWQFAKLNRHHFSIFGDFALSFPIGRWKFSDHFVNNLDQEVIIQLPNLYGGLTMAKVFAGLAWEYQWSSLKQKVALKVGYEGQIWLNLYRVYTFNQGRLSSPLTFQGATIDLMIDF